MIKARQVPVVALVPQVNLVSLVSMVNQEALVYQDQLVRLVHEVQGESPALVDLLDSRDLWDFRDRLELLVQLDRLGWQEQLDQKVLLVHLVILVIKDPGEIQV